MYCDWYIEICKTRLNGDDAQAADTARKVLVYVLDRALKLLHPFMPFITEEIYQALPGSGETIMTQLWPGNENMKIWAEDCADFEKLMNYIKAVRRGESPRQAGGGDPRQAGRRPGKDREDQREHRGVGLILPVKT